jgi:DNA-binding transcriptional regulator YiaG
MNTTTTLDTALARARARLRLPAPQARRFLRERAGLSIPDMAAALRVSHAAVRHWESGRRTPRPSLAEAYLKILDRLAAETLRS